MLYNSVNGMVAELSTKDEQRLIELYEIRVPEVVISRENTWDIIVNNGSGQGRCSLDQTEIDSLTEILGKNEWDYCDTYFDYDSSIRFQSSYEIHGETVFLNFYYEEDSGIIYESKSYKGILLTDEEKDAMSDFLTMMEEKHPELFK